MIEYDIQTDELLPFYSGKKVLICGGDGFIGSHLTNILKNSDAIITVVGRSKNCRRIKENENLRYVSANLLELQQCKKISKDFDIIFQLAGVVGGIDYNILHQGTLFSSNSLINLNMLMAARESDIERYQYVSSVAVYPKNAENLLKESTYIFNEPEQNNFGYSWAKRIGEIQCKLFAEEFGMKISVIRPDNTYGPYDNFDPKSSRVIPSLIHKIMWSDDLIHVWGSGKQIRTFVFVNDLIRGLLLALEKYTRPDPINIHSNEEISIKSLAELIVKLSKKNIKIKFDVDKPEGILRRCLDITKSQKLLRFLPKWNLEKGLSTTLEWYKNSCHNL